VSDLSCGPMSYYPPEPLVCEAPPPETLVCEAPAAPPPKPAPTRDHLPKPPSPGKSKPQLSFIDPGEELVCKAPPSTSFEMRPAPIPASQFDARLENSSLMATLDLELTDHDGFQTRSQGDIQGTIQSGSLTLNRDSFLPALQALKGQKQENAATNTSTEIKNIRFDAHTQAYILDLEVTKKILKIPVWDNFQVQFKANSQGQLEAVLKDNWFPDAKILNQLEASIRSTMRKKVPASVQETVRLNTRQQDNRLILEPEIKKLEIPLGQGTGLTLTGVNASQAHLKFDAAGNLGVNLKQIPFQASSKLDGPESQIAGPADKMQLHVDLALGKDQSRQVFAKGKLHLDLSAQETPQVKLGSDRLSDFLKSGTLVSDFSLHLKQVPGQSPQLAAHSEVSVKNADLGQGQPVELKTSLQLHFDQNQGLILETADHSYDPLKLNTTQNGVELFIDGKEFFPKMKAMIQSAQHSVDLETFMFTDDAVGNELATLLAQKAAGLDASGKKLATATGVAVRFIFNSWKGNAADGEASARMLENARKKIAKQIEASALTPPQKQAALSNLERNLNWTFFSEGILRSDHRKVMVIDGEQASVGGMNLGEHYLGEKSYHDLSIRMAGPEVREVQREFLENWYEFRKETPPTDWQAELKSPEELNNRLATLQSQGHFRNTAQVQTLVTDDRQVDIERGLVKLIDEAQSEINIEQAFFSDETILKHLSAAIDRGVRINIVVAETPLASGVFSAANLLSAHALAKRKAAGALGDVHYFSYARPAAEASSQIHAKAVSVDGKRALVGSANLIGRSLGSPFTRQDSEGKTSQALFNKEMSLLLENPQFVEEINQRLFQRDQVHYSRELNAEEILKAVEAAGGEKALRMQALAAPFT